MVLGYFLGQGGETYAGIYVKVFVGVEEKEYTLKCVGSTSPVYLVVKGTALTVHKEDIVDVITGSLHDAVKAFIEKGYHKQSYSLVTPTGDILKVEE